MATIGLDRLYYAKITENDAGEETLSLIHILSKVKSHHTPSELAKPAGTPISELEKRLALIKP